MLGAVRSAVEQALQRVSGNEGGLTSGWPHSQGEAGCGCGWSCMQVERAMGVRACQWERGGEGVCVCGWATEVGVSGSKNENIVWTYVFAWPR